MKKIFLMATMAVATLIPAMAQTAAETDVIAQEELQIAEQSAEQLAGQQSAATAKVDPKINGEWTIYNLRGDKVTGEERPFINIVAAEGRFYGNNGCNIINGSVDTPSKGAISFDRILSTRMMCQDAPFEYMINVTLPEVKFYSIKQYGHESYLDLENERHQVIMVLRRHNMDFLNGAWAVTRIDGESNTDEGIQMVIDIPEGRIHGNTGCNLLNGSILIDPDKSHSVQFDHIGVTRRACPDMAKETSFLVALEEVEGAYAEGNNAVVLRDNRGREVIKMRRLSAEELRAQE
ncbi:MAG: META domain-containing protein [Muribaculaceae bacterium]|nr:META domain-containing protein [Muribaculaceae bacterium]